MNGQGGGDSDEARADLGLFKEIGLALGGIDHRGFHRKQSRVFSSGIQPDQPAAIAVGFRPPPTLGWRTRRGSEVFAGASHDRMPA